MVSTTEGATDNIPNVPMTSTLVKKPNATKSLCLFTDILMLKIKQKNVVLELQNKNTYPLKV